MGFVVLVIGLSMGFNSGYAVNPARDLGPRLFTAMAGWGSGVFTYVHIFYAFSPLMVYFYGTLLQNTLTVLTHYVNKVKTN